MRFKFGDSVPDPGGSGGGSIHLSFRSGSRGKGSSAGAAFAYLCREDEYAGPDRDPAIYSESDHMPEWARDDAREYWDAADRNERANGRLYVSADFALPRELSEDDQIELARDFAHDMTDDEELPYTLAVHAGRDEEGRSHNPHAHLMFSERGNDGIERSPSDWFRRANPESPERGGAPKSRTFHGSGWVEHARERWAELTNQALERAGRQERVDHRSYARQGIDREPGTHYGPSAAYILAKGHAQDRLNDALAVGDDRSALQHLDTEIGRLERTRDEIIQYGLPEERGLSGPQQHSSSGADRDDDNSRGR